MMQVLHEIPPAPAVEPRRLYYLDWLKILAILLVFSVHVSMPFQTVQGVWLIQDSQTSPIFTLFAAFIYQWIMHLFFFVAGAGARFALVKYDQLSYLTARVQRLFIPLVACTMIFMPFQEYLSLKSMGQIEGSFPQFFPDWFTYCARHYSPLLVKYGCYVRHLWFLGFLFVYAVLTLPLLAWLKGSTGMYLVSWVSAKLQRPAALLGFVLLPAVIQATLRAHFPQHQNFSDFCVWLVYFIYGFVFLSERRFMQAVVRSRWIALVIGLACFSAILALLVLGGYAGPWELSPVFSPRYALYQVLRSLNSWAWVVFALGMGRRHLNFNNRLLQYTSEAILPFYILHHIFVIAITYALLPWNPLLVVKFLALGGGVLLVTLGLYELLVKRIKLLRYLFGMRPSKSSTYQKHSVTGFYK